MFRDTYATQVSSGKYSTTPGTAVQLSATDTHVRLLHIQADPWNAQHIVVGDSAVSRGTHGTKGSRTGKLLAPGEHYDWPLNNLTKAYLDVFTSGDGLILNYYRD